MSQVIVQTAALAALAMVAVILWWEFGPSTGGRSGKFVETPWKWKARGLLKPSDVPSYTRIFRDNSNRIWDCGESNNSKDAMCYVPEGDSRHMKPLALDKNDNENIYDLCYPELWYSKCCASREGCRPTGRFNWILGTCFKDTGSAGGGICGDFPRIGAKH